MPDKGAAAMRYWSVFVVALLAPIVARAEEADALGIGIKTCAQFAEAYQSSPDFTETLYITWGNGYLTGLNVAEIAAKHKRKNLAALPIEERKRWLREWCARNPLRDYAEGVQAYFHTLPTLSNASQ